MNYKLVITEKAEALFDNLFYYLIYKLKNHQAAKHLITSIRNTYKRIQENPFQFPESHDSYLSVKHYREAPLTDMRYVILYQIIESTVYIEGVYHQLELYSNKINN